MATSTDDFDRFITALAEELGSDTVMLLSAQGSTRPMLGLEALPQFAAGLFGFFVAGFVGGISKQAAAAATALGKKQAEKLKEAWRKLQQTGKASQEDRQQALAAAHEAVREAAAQPELAAACNEAAGDGKAEVAAQLKALGMEAAEAEEKADKLVQLVLAGTRKP